jgi:hypothetical protein
MLLRMGHGTYGTNEAAVEAGLYGRNGNPQTANRQPLTANCKLQTLYPLAKSVFG